MPIINTLPNTIANGQLEDAVPVMANFNWILSQVNGNACPATSGSSILKGNGTGGTISATAGTDYAGITSVNTFAQLQSGIAATAGANFPIASQVQASAFNTGTTGGTVDAITAAFTPAFTALASAPVWWRATGANTIAAPTFKRDGLVAKTIVKGSNQALVAGDIPGVGAWMCSQYDATLDKEVLINPAFSAGVGPATATVAGLNTKNLIYEQVISGAAVSAFTSITGLDLNTAKSYRIELDLVNATASKSTIGMYANGDTTPTDYYVQGCTFDGATSTPSRTNGATIAATPASIVSNSVISLSIAGGYLLAYANFIQGVGATITQGSLAWAKTASVANLTQLDFTADVASSIGIGSKLRIYRGDN